MPITLPVTYPLDLTGNSPDNYIQGEPHTLTHNRTIRVIVPTYGGFFSESMIVTDMANNQLLNRATDFQCVELYEVPTAKSGKEVCGLVLVTNPAVSDNVQISYQSVGGPYSNSPEALLSIANALELDNRPISWPAILGKPSGFPPSQHLHDVGDVYGFEYLVHVLERIRQAILIGDDQMHAQILRYIDDVTGQHPSLSQVASIINSALAAHVTSPTAHAQYRAKNDITDIVQVINATTTSTEIDLSSGAYVYIVNMQSNTLLSFVNIPPGYASWGVITVNDATAGRALAFQAGTRFAGGFLPPRTTAAFAVDEWWFDVRNTGAPIVGSLAVKDAK